MIALLMITDKIVSKYQKRDSRIKYYRLANNSGAAVARTVAMRLASGKYIAFWIVMTGLKMNHYLFYMMRR